MIDIELIKEIINNSKINIDKFKEYYGDNYLNYYQVIYSKYKYILELVLENKYHISLLDKHFIESELKFEKLNEEKNDIYKKTSFMKYNYYYLRNNIYLERLSKEELDLILKLNLNNKEDLLKMISLVTESYIKLIKEYDYESNVFICGEGINDPDKSYLDGNVCYAFRYNQPFDLFDNDPISPKQCHDIYSINQINSKNGLSLIKLDDTDFIKGRKR